MRIGPLQFREIWFVDFEFSAPTGEPPTPVCLVAREFESGQMVRLWQDEFCRRTEPPYAIDDASLFVAYYASAELGCHLALGWELPANVLDLYAEFRHRTNGRDTPCGSGLLGAMAYFGLSAVKAAEKDSMRKLALRGGPWATEERAALLNCCEGDVRALAELLPRMLPGLDLPRALLRGRYMRAAAHIEATGVPIDRDAYRCLVTGWSDIQDRLIARIDVDYGVFDGRTFKVDRWADYLIAHRIPWPCLPSGVPNLDDDTFREMARAYPAIAPLRELRVALSQMRLADLAVGGDDRNRCLLSAFQARTGRNQPSNSRFIFGPAVWLRGLIRPTPGWGLAYVDWSQQEFGIAAALSGDPAMQAAYESGDPYLTFAKQAGAVPTHATGQTHGGIRELFKAAALAVQYGMGEITLAQRIGQPAFQARELLRRHRQIYKRFWCWSDGAVDYANLHGHLETVFGWTIHVGPSANSRSLRNFPMQANGAEMLRLACCFATEREIRVCAPVHDAMLIEAPLDELDAVVRATQAVMAEASAMILDGFALRSSAKVIRHPERYQDDRGQRMWNTVWEILGGITSTGGCATHPEGVSRERACNMISARPHTRPISSSMFLEGRPSS